MENYELNLTGPEQSSKDARLRIIAAAEELFAVRGFRGVSIREIADHARVNSAMIHYYFDTKEGLYRGVIVKALSELNAIIETVSETGGDPVDRLRCYLRQYIEFLRRKSRNTQLILHAVLFEENHLSEWIDRYWTRHFQLIEEILREGVEDGYFRPVDTRLTAINLRGMVLWYFMFSPIISRYPGMEDYQQEYNDKLADETMDILLHGLLNR